MKRLNFSLKITAIVLSLGMLISLAWLGSDAFWWLFNPLATNPYASTPSIHLYDNSIKYINNRAPFGVIVVEKPKVAVISDNIKLTGIYLNTDKDSIAFMEVNKKSIIAKIGDEIVPGTKVESINADRIILNTNGSNQDLTLEKGTNEANNSINLPADRQPTPDIQSPNQINNLSPDVNSQTSANNLQKNDTNLDEVRVKRKKMIEDMMKSDHQKAEPSTNNANNK